MTSYKRTPRRSRRDKNEHEIVRNLRSLPGFRVITLSSGTIGDLLVRRDSWEPGRWVMVEVKSDRGELADHQAEALHRGETILARSLQGLLDHIGA